MRNLLQFGRVGVAQAVAKQGRPVRLKWYDPSGTGAVLDPTTNAWVGGSGTLQIEDTRALAFYEVGESETRYRMFEEVEIGNGILDLPATVTVDGRLGLVFEIGGEDWVQKEVGERLKKSWQDMQGVRLVQSFLLRRQT